MSKLRQITESGIYSFDDYKIFDNQKKKKVLKKETNLNRNIVLDLYRGFDANLNDIKRKGDKLILSPDKSEQGLIWFTHILIGYYDPIDYARSHGEWLLTYPLKCLKHYDRVWYDDGSIEDSIPKIILDKTDPLNNCKFHMGIELPDGWVFSYKTEKFIGCTEELLVDENMITKS